MDVVWGRLRCPAEGTLPWGRIPRPGGGMLPPCAACSGRTAQAPRPPIIRSSLPDTFHRVRTARQNANLSWSCGTVNSILTRQDCEHGARCLRARAVPSEKYSCRGDPPDQSAGVARYEYKQLPNVRPTTWRGTARGASDPSACDPRSNWLQCSSHDFCYPERWLPHAYARHRAAPVGIQHLHH